MVGLDELQDVFEPAMVDFPGIHSHLPGIQLRRDLTWCLYERGALEPEKVIVLGEPAIPKTRCDGGSGDHADDLWKG
jgi:hypothetical protein